MEEVDVPGDEDAEMEGLRREQEAALIDARRRTALIVVNAANRLAISHSL